MNACFILCTFKSLWQCFNKLLIHLNRLSCWIHRKMKKIPTYTNRHRLNSMEPWKRNRHWIREEEHVHALVFSFSWNKKRGRAKKRKPQQQQQVKSFEHRAIHTPVGYIYILLSVHSSVFAVDVFAQTNGHNEIQHTNNMNEDDDDRDNANSATVNENKWIRKRIDTQRRRNSTTIARCPSK